MTTAPVNPRPHRAWADYFIIAGFLLLLAAPAADKFFHLDHSRLTSENRLPAPAPDPADLRAGRIQKYLVAGEAYFNDHFGFRNQLVRWFQNWRLGLFHDHSVYSVVIGPNHWLFIGEEQMVEHFIGLRKFTPEELSAWQKLLERRRDWLAARGIKYLFVVPPDKQDIYPEELPAWLRNAVPAGRETKLDQFLKFMRAHSTVEILDLRAPLLAAKPTAPMYFQNDTHWNQIGGFLGCQELVKALTRQFPDLPPLRSEDFRWTNVPATGGDLSRMIGADLTEKNSFKLLAQPSVTMPVVQTTTNLPAGWDPHKSCAISDNVAPLTETAMVFHDSFGMFWRPVLGCCFKRVWYLAESRDFRSQFILENHPSVVINEILERYFNTADPQLLLAHDGLP